MVNHGVISFLAFITLSVPSYAMDRYYCAADDSQLKLSIETGFKEQPGWPLGHLRGIVVFKPEQVTTAQKTLEGTLMLGAGDVVQYWRDGRSMKIRTSSKSGTGNATIHADVLLESRIMDGDINRFIGGYRIIVSPLGNGDPSSALTREGKISCSRF